MLFILFLLLLLSTSWLCFQDEFISVFSYTLCIICIIFILSWLDTFTYLTNIYWLYQAETTRHSEIYTYVYSCSPPSLEELHTGLCSLNATCLPPVRGIQTLCLLSTKLLFSLWSKKFWNQQTGLDTAWKIVSTLERENNFNQWKIHQQQKICTIYLLTKDLTK